MPQAGIHAMVGTAVRKWTPKTEWLLLGVVLGNFLPDFDNFVVAAATLVKAPSEGIHRTFSHSLVIVLAIYLLFLLVGNLTKQRRWSNLGLGLAIGMTMHILLDLVIWFNGVQILWPFPSWINLWEGIKPPDWFDKFMNPAEFLCMGLYFVVLRSLAQKSGTDADFLRTINIWIIVLFLLFVVFTPLAYIMQKGFLTIFGVFYLFTISLAFAVTIRMRKTVETVQ